MVAETQREAYERTKDLIRDYYNATSNKGNIEIFLEGYSLTGKEVLELMDELIEIHPEYIRLSKQLEKAQEKIGKIEEIIKGG